MNAKKIQITENTVEQGGVTLSLKMIQSYAEKVHGIRIHFTDESHYDAGRAEEYDEFSDATSLVNPTPSDILATLKRYSKQINFMICHFE